MPVVSYTTLYTDEQPATGMQRGSLVCGRVPPSSGDPFGPRDSDVPRSRSALCATSSPRRDTHNYCKFSDPVSHHGCLLASAELCETLPNHLYRTYYQFSTPQPQHSCSSLHLMSGNTSVAPVAIRGGSEASIGDSARFGVLTVSDRASSGVYEDLSGPAILQFFQEAVESPWEAVYRVIADEQPDIEAALIDMVGTHLLSSGRQ